MIDETVLLVLIIAGFLALSIFSLAAMLVMYRREKDRQEAKSIEKAIDDLDGASGVALHEINKLGATVQDEIDKKMVEIQEKYNSILFLYNLVDEKEKEIMSRLASHTVRVIDDLKNEGEEAQIKEISHSVKPEVQTEVQAAEPEEAKPIPAQVLSDKIPKFNNSRHKRIWEMRREGHGVPEIAKALEMGQGEVKLILDILDLAS